MVKIWFLGGQKCGNRFKARLQYCKLNADETEIQSCSDCKSPNVRVK